MTSEAAARSMAVTALAYWGKPVTEPRLAKFRENIVFEVRLEGVGHAALRLHRPGYQSRAAIAAELTWTEMLAAGGMAVPAPVRTVQGAQTVRVGERIATLVRWLPGEPIGAAEHPLAGTAAMQRTLMERLGGLIAALHATTDRLRLPADFPRPHWDAEGFLGDAPRWGAFWTNPSFSAAERAEIAAMRVAARQMMPAIGAADFGLIHADVLRENVLSDGGRLALIDFDDSGWGFRLYDLATALVQSLEEAALPDIAAGLIAGYAAGRGWSAAEGRLLPLFVMLRTFASAGWIAGRAAPDDPRQRFYAERALRMARHVSAGTTPWD